MALWKWRRRGKMGEDGVVDEASDYVHTVYSLRNATHVPGHLATRNDATAVGCSAITLHKYVGSRSAETGLSCQCCRLLVGFVG